MLMATAAKFNDIRDSRMLLSAAASGIWQVDVLRAVVRGERRRSYREAGTALELDLVRHPELAASSNTEPTRRTQRRHPRGDSGR